MELDETKLQQILMELDILHKSTSEDIVEFYGAFFIESCVYYCMEYMDCGSLDKLYGDGVPEDVLAKIAISVRIGRREVLLRRIGSVDGVQGWHLRVTLLGALSACRPIYQIAHWYVCLFIDGQGTQILKRRIVDYSSR